MSTRLPRFDTVAQLHAWAHRNKKAPVVMSPSEYIAREEHEHFALVEWRDLVAGQIPELRWLFHVPNGEFRTKGTAAKLARMGVLAGVADFLWCVPRGPFHGLALELKAAHGTLSDPQRAFLAHVTDNGYFAAVCYGWHTARTTVLDYYGGRLSP